MKNKITSIIENYGMLITPEEDINIAEAMDIIQDCETNMEIVGNSYLYGYIRGCFSNRSRMVPMLGLQQMTDDEWQELSARNKSTYRR